MGKVIMHRVDKVSQEEEALLGYSLMHPSMSEGIGDLIRAIDRMGIRNVSALSRMTGIPKETVRYNIKKRFPEFGLRVEAGFNLGALGLQRYSGIIRFSPKVLPHAAAILDRLAHIGFLWYRSETLLEPSHMTSFVVPVVVEDEFKSLMERLVKEGIFAAAELTRMDWARNPELMCQYYDFDSRRWSIDWQEIGMRHEAPPSPVEAEQGQVEPTIDRSDVLLIKELEASSFRSLESISKKLGMNPVTLRWHYRRHVLPLVSYNRVRWLPSSTGDEAKAVGVSLEFSQLHRSQLERVRLLFNNFPFTWFEAGSHDGSYRADLAVPAEEFVHALGFLNARIGEISLPSWKAHILNPLTTMRYTIPYENFSEEKGWVFDSQRAWESIVSIVGIRR